MSFIECFVLNGWLLVLFCPHMMSSHLWRLFVLAFDGLHMFKFIEHLFDPSEAFQMSSPNWTLVFLGPFPP